MHLNKRKYSIPNNRYERHLNLLSDSAWNDMCKTSWDELLYKFSRIRFSKSNYDESNESDEEEYTSSEANDPACEANETRVNEFVNKTTASGSINETIVNESVNRTKETKFEELIINIEFFTIK